MPGSADLGVADHGMAAADLLVGLITRAVKSSNDQGVRDLDQVLRHVERIIDMTCFAADGGGRAADDVPKL